MLNEDLIRPLGGHVVPRRRRKLTAAGLATAIAASGSLLAVDQVATAAEDGGGAVPATDLSGCETGVACTFSLAGVPLESDASITLDRFDDGTVVVRGDLSAVSTKLAAAELFFEPDPRGGHRYVRGEARLQDIVTPAIDFVDLGRVGLGVAHGSDLAGHGAHVRDDRSYWYFHAAAGVTVAPGSAMTDQGLDFAPLELPAGASTVFAMDPTDPYVYVGASCDLVSLVAGAFGNDKSTDGAERATDNSNNNTDNNTDNNTGARDGSDSAAASTTPTPGAFSTVGCGLGASMNGLIPTTGVAGSTPFESHLVIDAEVSTPVGVTITGPTKFRFDDGIRIMGTGDIAWGVPYIGDVLGFSLPLGDAAVDMQIGGGRYGLGIAGRLSTENGYDVPLMTETVSFPADAYVAVQARFGGEVGGSIDADSFLAIDGALSVLDTELAAGHLRIDRRGVAISGIRHDLVTTMQMEGHIRSDGAQLTGRSRVDLPLDAIGRAADQASADLDEAQADVDRIEGEMTRTRATIRAERRAASAELVAAADQVATARSAVASINKSVATNNSKISALKKKISREKKAFKRVAWYRRASKAPRYVARLAAWNSAIAGLRVANTTLIASRDVATATLRTAEDVVRLTGRGLDALPTDADPRMLGLFTAHAVATESLALAKAVVEPFRFESSYHGEVEMTVGTNGTGGSFSATRCTDGKCTILMAGTIEQEGGDWVGCVILAPGVPETCTTL